MDEFILSHGYLALFILSFLASTLVPLGSEWLLVTLLCKGFDPTLTVLLATAGNTLGACTTYLIGIHGGNFLLNKVLRSSPESRQKAERFYNRYGCWSLLFSWLPVLGDPLCLAGGVLRVNFVRFSLLVASGKFARYLIVCWLTLQMAKA